MTTPRQSRILLAIFAAAGLALSVYGWLVLAPSAPAFPRIGGPFSLTAQDGRTVTDKAFEGRPTLLFFGYTHCPDICPTTLFQLSELLRAMGPQPGVNAAMVTVDPERDTAPVLADYLQSFDPHLVALTGERPVIDGMLKDYRVYAKKVPGKDGDYTMDHSALVYLMDKHGRFVGAFNLDRAQADNIAQLRALM